MAPLPSPNADKEILAARDAFERRDLKALGALKERLGDATGKSHPLNLYTQYWWLTLNLAKNDAFASANAGEIRAFLAANPDTVAADNLRRDWLKVLGK
ncbi:MAG: hypothetical protein ABL931_18450, partial [Usitatibacteraceae bacterium]